MRVALLTIGTRGDVQPFVVLGAALHARGHDVVLAAGPEFAPMAAVAGIGFRPFTSLGPGSAADMLSNPRVRAALKKGPSLFRMAFAQPKRTSADMSALVDEMVAAGEGADVVVNTTLTRIGALVHSDAPWCSVNCWPTTPTTAWPALGAPDFPLGGPARGAYNRMTHNTRDYFDWQIYRLSANSGRRTRGLKRLGLASQLRETGRVRPLLYQFSPSVFPPPADWPARCHVTGYWEAEQTAERPVELVKFLDSGEKPLVVTFGSAWSVGGDELWDAAVRAGTRLGRRMVFVGGPETDFPGDVEALRVESVDYQWLLPRAAVVLHHGGQGTTAAVVKAGVPQVVVPCYADQPVWARQLAALGVAARPVPYAKLTPELLTDAVRSVLADPAMATRAAALAEAASHDPGVGMAVEVVEDWASSAPSPAVHPGTGRDGA